MIYIFSPNPSLDYYMPLETLKKGEVNRTSNAYFTVGGKGINVAKTLLSLGVIDIRCLGFIAGFTGREIAKQCRSEGINAEFIMMRPGNSRVNVKIGENGEENTQMTEINAAAPEISDSDCENLLEKLREIKSGDYLVLAGNTPDTAIYTAAADICNKNGGRLVVDCDGETLRELLLKTPFLIKPNHYEFCKLCGIPPTDNGEALIKKLDENKINAENILLSMGGKGAILASKGEQTLIFSAPEGRVKNTVGAGDTMLAAFIKYFDGSNGDRKKSLEFAVMTASKKVLGL
jgi:1-phosphofructokinase